MTERLIPHAIEGALGGALGTLFISEVPHWLRGLPAPLSPTEPRRDPGSVLISRIEKFRGRPFPLATHARYATIIHWIYGVGLGASLGALTARRTLRAPGDALVAGAVFGTVVWAGEYGVLLPTLKVTPSLQRQGIAHAGTTLATLVAYGLIVAAPIFVVDRLTRKKSWMRRIAEAFVR